MIDKCQGGKSMRAKIKLVGMKRVSGVSTKTNQPYDFTEVSFTYPVKNYTGIKAASAIVDADLIEGINLEVGKEFDAFFHEVKGKVYIDGLLKV